MSYVLVGFWKEVVTVYRKALFCSPGHTHTQIYIGLLHPRVKPGSSRTQIYEDYHKDNMFSAPVRSPHTFEAGA